MTVSCFETKFTSNNSKNTIDPPLKSHKTINSKESHSRSSNKLRFSHSFLYQIVCYPDLHHPLDRMNIQRSNSNMWKKNGTNQMGSKEPEQLKVMPYIPQPDYTPAPTRRAESFRIQQSRPSVNKSSSNKKQQQEPNSVPDVSLPRLDMERKPTRPMSFLGQRERIPEIKEEPTSSSGADREWNHPQWNSSQFQAYDWNAALMKRLSVEAQTMREEKIRRAADSELDRFESEIDSYLPEEDEEDEGIEDVIMTSDRKKVSSGNSTPYSSSTMTASPASSSSPSRAGESGVLEAISTSAGGRIRPSRDRIHLPPHSAASNGNRPSI